MTHRPKMKRKKEKCPFKKEGAGMNDSENVHNSPDWYTKEFIPMIGANFNSLTSVGIEGRLMGSGMQINTAVNFLCAITPPLDPYSSHFKKILDLWTEIREMNSGATNYTPAELASYIYNVFTLRALIHHAARGLSAVRHGSALVRESPAIYLQAVGYKDYVAESTAYASNFNALSLLMKDTEFLTIVPFSYLDRLEFLFTTIFADSKTTRPAMMSFVPKTIWTYSVDNNDDFVVSGVVLPDSQGTGCSIAGTITQAQTIFNLIQANNKNAIIRGDLLKAFGTGALRPNLIAELNMPFRLGYNEDVACQIENATIMGVNGGGTLTLNKVGASTLLLTAPNEYSDSMAESDHYIINFHGTSAPRDGALLALTRLHADASSSTSSTDVLVEATSGITVSDAFFITGSTPTAPTSEALRVLLGNVYSSIQSTAQAAQRKLTALIGLVDRFPMVVIDRADPFGFVFDIDNYTILDRQTLIDFTELANRSLLDQHLPRGETGRIDRQGMIR